MRGFIDDRFLLSCPTAERLYRDIAAELPIADYHCHLSPREIYEDKPWDSMTELWLGGDHYKWRLMRACGVEERYITGDAPDIEKFRRFAEILPLAAGNPLHSWCHLELKRYFGYDGILSAATADEVWELCGEVLKNDPSFTPRGLILKGNVRMIGTTDDPLGELRWHEMLAADKNFPVQVCPGFRPDPALEPQKPGFAGYLRRLEEATGIVIRSVEDVCGALKQRMDAFSSLGCRTADHGLYRPVCRAASRAELDGILRRAMDGGVIEREESEAYQTALLRFCASEYTRRGWVMQLHFSCMRNPSSRAFAALGPDAGFDSIAVTDAAPDAYRLFDLLERDGILPRTVLYSLNPSDNAWLDTLAGAFQSPEIPGKIQHGSAWWFNDHEDGIREQLSGLAYHGAIGTFIGMLTDSRSFLSYARHEYFRRILCDMLGGLVESGRYPDDPEALRTIIEGVCWKNAERYFNL